MGWGGEEGRAPEEFPGGRGGDPGNMGALVSLRRRKCFFSRAPPGRTQGLERDRSPKPL